MTVYCCDLLKIHQNNFMFHQLKAELVMLIMGYRGRYVQINFQVVTEAAKAELLNFAGKDVL